VVFQLNTEVGKDVSIAELRARHDAVLIAAGVYKAREISGPGAGSKGVVPALPFLKAANRLAVGDPDPDFAGGPLDARDKDVVVIGGGDTAMDCVRTAARQGARSVTCLYRRDRANMPGSFREVANAEEEGVAFEFLAAPKAMLGGAEGVSGVRAARMRLGPPDQSGRQTPEEAPGLDFDVPAQMVVKALGFDAEDLPSLWGAPDLKVTRWGTVRTDFRTMMTSMDGVYAAGDVVRGASLVVWAIRDGLDAAAAIDRRLQAAARPAMAAE
jgi:glutamate synthase (NADPH/NADH) small chain